MSSSTATSTSSSISSASPSEPKAMQLQGVIGFNGSVPGSVLLHPDDQRLFYPLGSTIVVKHLRTNAQHFLSKGGHDRDISALALSPCGRFLASGQSTHLGFVATLVVWDLQTLTPLHKWPAHKGRVQSLSFSADSALLASVGGRDDMKLTIWDLRSGQALCTAQAANDSTSTVRFLRRDPDRLVTGGSHSLRVWRVDRQGRKLSHTDCQLGQLKRVIQDIAVDSNDQLMYCATTTGDVLTVDIAAALYKGSHPSKLLVQGVTRVLLLPRGGMVVGTGDGAVVLLDASHRVVRSVQVKGGITSLVLNAAGDHVFIATERSQLYLAAASDLEHELRATGHTGRVTGLAFPSNYSEVFATCAGSDIRVWNARTLVELLRVEVPGGKALSLAFAPDGKAIVSGWEDGKVRAFTPQTGRALWTIEDAHVGGVTALAMTGDGRRLISGGEGGQVRVWAIEREQQRMLASMSEHQQRVNAIVLDARDAECVSASNDGSCIQWSLSRYTRMACMFAPTQFRSVCYHPEYAQLLTSGSDRKLMYWDVTTQEVIRVMEAGGGAGTSVDVTGDGEVFVTGGEDKVVRVWEYDRGVCGWVGAGHAGGVTHVRVSPDGGSLVSVGEEGAVLVWRMPQVEVEREGKRVERVDLREAAREAARGKREEEKETAAVPPPAHARAVKRGPIHARK